MKPNEITAKDRIDLVEPLANHLRASRLAAEGAVMKLGDQERKRYKYPLQRQ